MVEARETNAVRPYQNIGTSEITSSSAIAVLKARRVPGAHNSREIPTPSNAQSAVDGSPIAPKMSAMTIVSKTRSPPTVGVGADRAHGHHPAFWVDPLEQRSLQKSQRRRGRSRGVGRHRRCGGDPVGQIEHVSRADAAQDFVDDGKRLEHPAQSQADSQHYDREADVDAEDMRNAAHEAEIGS